MKSIKILVSIISLLLVLPIAAQISPGGVGTNGLTAWFRADDLSPGDVTAWTTQFPTGTGTVQVDDPLPPYPQLEVTPNGEISNYNRTISFIG